MKKLFKKTEVTEASYESRNLDRERTLNRSTMFMVKYFVLLGNSEEVAESNVKQMSNEVADKLYLYTLGNTQPLIDGINATTLPFMNAEAKAAIIGQLTV